MEFITWVNLILALILTAMASVVGTLATMRYSWDTDWLWFTWLVFIALLNWGAFILGALV